MEETKVIYYIDDEQTPYLVKIPMTPSQVTLKDFKLVLNKQNCNYKYFFKSVDADFGWVLFFCNDQTNRFNLKTIDDNWQLVYFWLFDWYRVVKEEIVDDSTVLPVFSGRVISWVCCTSRKMKHWDTHFFLSFFLSSVACDGGWIKSIRQLFRDSGQWNW